MIISRRVEILLIRMKTRVGKGKSDRLKVQLTHEIPVEQEPVPGFSEIKSKPKRSKRPPAGLIKTMFPGKTVIFSLL
jgi:hypothetical protein